MLLFPEVAVPIKSINQSFADGWAFFFPLDIRYIILITINFIHFIFSLGIFIPALSHKKIVQQTKDTRISLSRANLMQIVMITFCRQFGAHFCEYLILEG